jgi:hypothetical protein
MPLLSMEIIDKAGDGGAELVTPQHCASSRWWKWGRLW